MKQKTVWLVFVLLCLNITMSRADEGKLEVWKASSRRGLVER